MQMTGITMTKVDLALLEPKKQDVEQEGRTNGDIFDSMLNGAKELLNKTNEADIVANTKTQDFILGKNQDIHGLQIAQEQAGIMMQLTTQVRNNVIEAYKEVMRISV